MDYTSMVPIVKKLGLVDYMTTWEAMKAFTAQRLPDTPDELWVVEHPSVYTQGLAGKPEHVLAPGTIPVIETDRGGQVTYHGPGQLVVYLLIDIKRLGLGVRQLVRRIEQAIIDVLAQWGIAANGSVDAPGVYVDGAKIASLGLRIKNHAVYHGLSLNVNLDLTPFSHINPCGYAHLQVTRLADLGVMLTPAQVADVFLPYLIQQLNTPSDKA